MNLSRSRALTAALSLLAAATFSVLVATPAHAAGGSISGTVKNTSGDPLMFMFVQAYDFNPGTQSITPVGAPVETDAQGHYELDGIPSGNHKVQVEDSLNLNYATQAYPDAANVQVGGDVPVVDGSTTSGIDLTLKVAGEIRGKVVDAGNQPVAGITVQPYYSDGALWEPVDTTGPVVTDATGSYRYAAVRPGFYRVAFVDDSGAQHPYVVQWATDSPDLGHADLVQVASTSIQHIDVTVSKLNTIQGTVTDSEHAPLGGVGVILWDVSGASPTQIDGEPTDPSGHYAFHEVPPGSYKVTTHDASGSFGDGASATQTFDGSDPSINKIISDITMPAVQAPETPVSAVSIAGTAKVGSVLHAVPATWALTPAAVSFQWKANGVVVGSGASFTIPAVDLGRTITVVETATAAGHSAGTSTSAPTAHVAAGTITCGKLLITLSGKDKKPNVGERARLVASCAGTTIGRQWYLNGKPVAGKVGKAAAYVLGRGAQGKKLTLKVLLTRTGYTTLTKTFSLGKVGAKARH